MLVDLSELFIFLFSSYDHKEEAIDFLWSFSFCLKNTISFFVAYFIGKNISKH